MSTGGADAEGKVAGGGTRLRVGTIRAAALGALLLVPGASSAPAQDVPFDPVGLATGPHAEACMLLERFLEGVRTDLRRTVDAGLIDIATFRDISGSLPRWYRFLVDRGVREGDALLYRIRGDTLHSGYRAADGALLMRQTDVGRERRLAVLGSYLVEGSSFREGLVDSFVDDDGC